MDFGTPPALSANSASRIDLPPKFPPPPAESCRRGESRTGFVRSGSVLANVSVSRGLIAGLWRLSRVSLQEGAPHGRAPSRPGGNPTLLAHGSIEGGLPPRAFGLQEVAAEVA